MELSKSEQLAISFLQSQPGLMEALAPVGSKQVQIDQVYKFFENLNLGLHTSKLNRRGQLKDAEIIN